MVPRHPEPSPELEQRFRAGDEGALDVVARYYFPRICAFVARYFSWYPADKGPDDIAEEALDKLWRWRARLPPEVGIKQAWMTMASSAALSHIHKLQRQKKNMDRYGHLLKNIVSPRLDETMDHRRAVEAVREAIGTLPEPQRSIVSLRCESHLSLQEIADTLGIPVSKVSRLAKTGVNTLRVLLKRN
jgi:RNA polymerase sigma-70 factor, ECF subfamily